MGRPGLQQGAMQGEVLLAEQRFHLGRRHQLLQEAGHCLLVQQTIPVLGERGGVPDRIIRVQAHKPAECRF